jgi:hypothetical protein
MKTLKVLILEMLLDGEPLTVSEISRTWGEDRVRVWEWLDKFRKLGLCSMAQDKPGRGHPRGSACPHDRYVGDPVKISEYLRTT